MSAEFVDQPKLKLARLSVSGRRRNASINNLHHLVLSPKGAEYFVERLEMVLFTNQQYLDALGTAGFEASFDSKGLMGRGLYIGLKPLA